MKIGDIYKRNKRTVISLEYFPQKDNKLNNIYYTTDRLLCFNPSVISVTCGASGGAAVGTIPTVVSLNEKYGNYGIEIVAHSTLIGKSKFELQSLLMEMDTKGIRNVLALRGDPSPGEKFNTVLNGHKYASEYVEQIKLLNEGRHLTQDGEFCEGPKTNFCIGVAAYPDGHPECIDIIKSIEHLKIKEEKGANYAVTQMILDIDNYRRFVDLVRKSGIKIPVIPGIMLLGNYKRYKQIVLDAVERGISKISIPSYLHEKLENNKDNDTDFEKLYLEFTRSICDKLIERCNVPGLQLFTLDTPKYAYAFLDHLVNDRRLSKAKNDVEKLFTATKIVFSQNQEYKDVETVVEDAIRKYVNKFYNGSIITLVEEELKSLEVHGANLNEESHSSTYNFVANNIKHSYEDREIL